jgi:hypothetical protein
MGRLAISDPSRADEALLIPALTIFVLVLILLVWLVRRLVRHITKEGRWPTRSRSVDPNARKVGRLLGEIKAAEQRCDSERLCYEMPAAGRSHLAAWSSPASGHDAGIPVRSTSCRVTPR